MTEAKMDRRIQRQRERRARKQADCVLRAAVRAMGGDPDDFMAVDGYGDEKKYGECRGVDDELEEMDPSFANEIRSSVKLANHVRARLAWMR